MAGYLVPDHFHKQEMTEYSVMVASIFLGFTIAFALFSAATATRQTLQGWKRSRRLSVYIYMIWGHWLANNCQIIYLTDSTAPFLNKDALNFHNNCFGIISFLYLRDIIRASFWLWFFILVLWVFQSQLIVQIIVNRISLLIMVKSHARMIKWSVFGVWTAINVSVFVIWIPARLEINDTWIQVNAVWDRIEKSIFLIVDAGLNLYFIYLVRNRLIANGLTKYNPLFRFNIVMVAISVSADIILIGMMSMPNDLLYLQFQSVAYAVKLHIEMNMADLIKKVVRASNIHETALSSGIGQKSSSAGKSKSKRSIIHEPNTNYNNFLASISRGANQPYRGGHSTHIELGSHDNIELDDQQGPHVEGRGGIKKTTVVTQVVDGRSIGDVERCSPASSEQELRQHQGP